MPPSSGFTAHCSFKPLHTSTLVLSSYSQHVNIIFFSPNNKLNKYNC